VTAFVEDRSITLPAFLITVCGIVTVVWSQLTRDAFYAAPWDADTLYNVVTPNGMAAMGILAIAAGFTLIAIDSAICRQKGGDL